MTETSSADRYAWRTSADTRDEETRSDPAGIAPDGSDGVEVHLGRSSDDDDGSDVPWAGIGMLVTVLVTGAFAAGWHFGRRWGRLMGW